MYESSREGLSCCKLKYKIKIQKGSDVNPIHLQLLMPY